METKHPKISKAIDWLAATLIRIPAIIIIATIVIVVAFVITLLAAPEKAKTAWEFLSNFA